MDDQKQPFGFDNSQERVLFNASNDHNSVPSIDQKPLANELNNLLEQENVVQEKPLEQPIEQTIQPEINPEINPEILPESTILETKPIEIDNIVKSVDQAVVEQSVVLPQSKVQMMQKLLVNLQETVKQLNDLLAPYITSEQDIKIQLGQAISNLSPAISPATSPADSQIIEGLFNGEKMITDEGKEYSVPVNYASKSKLVEGDMLKLIITERGTFVFKQIKPIERVRVVGNLEQGPTGEYYVSTNNRRWRVLNASVTYFKGEIGDEVIILIPKEGKSRWAAVENIIRQA